MKCLFYENDENDEYYDIEKNECGICLNTEKYSTIFKLKDIVNNSCLCNTYFHKECLVKWINKNNSCPICRKNIQINFNNYYELCNNNTTIDILSKYVCLIQNIRIIVKVTIFLTVIQITLEIYQLIKIL
jgi:hypothetical protein